MCDTWQGEEAQGVGHRAQALPAIAERREAKAGEEGGMRSAACGVRSEEAQDSGRKVQGGTSWLPWRGYVAESFHSRCAGTACYS